VIVTFVCDRLCVYFVVYVIVSLVAVRRGRSIYKQHIIIVCLDICVIT